MIVSLFQLLHVTMEMSGWYEGALLMKGGLRYARMGHGAQSVTMAGTTTTQP